MQGGSWCPVVGENDPIHKPEKCQRLFGNDPTVFQTCVLGLPGQVNKFRFESSASHGLGLLDPFTTQSNKSNITMINLDVCLKFYHG